MNAIIHAEYFRHFPHGFMLASPHYKAFIILDYSVNGKIFLFFGVIIFMQLFVPPKYFFHFMD